MFKQLKIYYLFVSLPFVLLLLGATVFMEAIKSTLMRNPHPQINYTIFVIILVGGIIILVNCRRLVREARALVTYSGALRAKTPAAGLQDLTSRLVGEIACVLQLMAASLDRSISHQEQAAIEHELTNAKTSLIRRNALPQYLTGLLVGMGLLGTFIGLLATLADISALIGSFADLDMSIADPMVVFRNMIERMKAPMQSMSIAFSASMYGLLGSIILGLMMVGIRRLQGDIFSLLSSEVARHVEIALSFESLSFRGHEAPGAEKSGGEITSKILLRIEERLAESARLRQRALAAEIDDFKKQREEMLGALSLQSTATADFNRGLQEFGGQLSAIFGKVDKHNSAMADQLSELRVHLEGDARKSQHLLATQVEELKALRESLDSFHIDERLAEAGRMQQRLFSAHLDDFQQQREDMLRALAEQSVATNGLSKELQQLETFFTALRESLDKGNGEIAHQLSELKIHATADARESHLLLGNVAKSLGSGIFQIDEKLAILSKTAEKGTSEVCSQLSQFAEQLAEDGKESRKLVLNVSNYFKGEFQQLGDKLAQVASVPEKEKVN